MTNRSLLCILVTSVWITGAACSASTGGASGTGGNDSGGSGGAVSTGGASSGSGGAVGSGGTPSTGGATGTGGKVSTGGATGSGGTTPVGGRGGTTSTGGSTGTGGGAGSGAAGSGAAGSTGTSNAMGPCDIYAMANNSCVAAISTVRVLLHSYTGPLYQVRKGGTNNVFKGNQPAGTGGGTTGGTTQDIGFGADGFADSAAEDAFCGSGGSACTISKIYDQSGKGNDLIESPAGTYEPGPDYEVPASHAVMVGTHKVYSLYFPHPPSLPSGSAPSGYGYRNNKTTGMPTGTAAQTVYMLADGTYAGNGCCFDFGNAETNNGNGPTGDMAAINLGTSYWGMGAGSSPWFEGDFEAGVWAGGSSCGTPGSGQLTCSGRQANPMNPSMKSIPYALGILKTATTNGSPVWTLKVANATTGTLTTAYDGAAPGKWMLQGALLLGTGGDNSNSSWGNFYEGCVTTGEASDATDQAIAANVAAVGYGK
jgi:non-reducing end alpha-L-arabinofuranosidase